MPEQVQPGLDVVAHVQNKIDQFARRWRDPYPAAVRSVLDDRDSLPHYLRTPREHWTRVRHSNFIERTFGETRRRCQGHRPAARRDQLHQPRVGRSRPRPLPGLARVGSR